MSATRANYVRDISVHSDSANRFELSCLNDTEVVGFLEGLLDLICLLTISCGCVILPWSL